MLLEGRTALITGASRGLGYEIAKAYLAEGADVFLVALSHDPLIEAAAVLRYMYPDREVWTAVVDVRHSRDIGDLFIHRELANIDILVNNAGMREEKFNVGGNDIGFWTRIVEVNLYGPLWMMQFLIPRFRSHNYGKIINISGGGATKPMPGYSAYAASKAALVRLTETVALELVGTGIDVNAVAPGHLPTRMTEGEDGPFDDFKKATELCVWLASHESDGITGKLISAVWDDYRHWPKELGTDQFTLRRQL